MSRILFVMRYPAYLRLYSTTVVALAARGHEVVLAYDKIQRIPGERLLPDGAPPHIWVAGNVPAHGGEWATLLVELGCTIDYVRFLSSHEGTPYLRMRMERYLPPRFDRLRRVRAWPAVLVRAAAAAARLAERALPVDPALVDYVRSIGPDVLVVTPLVLRGAGGVQQTQLVKAARSLGVPVALAVGSWDHLSSKGLIRVRPDRVIVWNDTQKREAVRMHGMPSNRIVVTGAQPFDAWFDRKPSMTRDDFLARIGLPADRPAILYVGSSRGIAKPEREIPFVRRWLEALRGSSDPVLRSASVLIRPHLSNMRAWESVDVSAMAPVAIWPRQRPSLPMTPVEADDYFHSMYYTAATVGINTSAMIEAAIVGRPVFTIQVPEFAATQDGTTHFHYLLEANGGCVTSARTFDAHVEQLRVALAHPGHGVEARRHFVRHFVRPHDPRRPAVEYVAEAIEAVAKLRPRPTVDAPRWLAPVRWLLVRAAQRMAPDSTGPSRPAAV